MSDRGSTVERYRTLSIMTALSDPSSNAETRPPSRGPRASAVISLSWSGIAFGAGALALASTSSLAIVTTLSHVNALATIALALAILSFIIQIGLFVAQSWTSGQQVLHSEELNSDTRAILAEVRENARGTNRLISDQFERVLTHLLETTKRTVNESIKGPEAERLNARLDRELRNTLRKQISADPFPFSRELSARERDRLRLLQTVPVDSAERAASDAVLGSLSPAATVDLGALAKDEISNLEGGFPSNRGLFRSLIPQVDELLAAGLVEQVDRPRIFEGAHPGQDYFVLTDKGRETGRLITGSTQNGSPSKPESGVSN